MFFRQSRPLLQLYHAFARNIYAENFTAATYVKCYACSLYSTGPDFTELPRKRKRSEKKPWVTHINEIKRKVRSEKEDRIAVKEAELKPPENGLLVKELIPVAHEVSAARTRLLSCVSRVLQDVPIFVCSVCGDVHVGDPPHKIRTCDVSGSQKNKEHTWEIGGIDHVFPVVESFHLYDRVGRAVSHKERLQVDRIPAVVELCIQAGLDIPEYPTRRRDFPVYRVAGKIIDFEKRFPKNDSSGNDINPSGFWQKKMKKRLNDDQPTRRRDFPVYRVAGKIIDFEKRFPKNDSSGNDINPSGFWQKKMKKRLNDDQKSLNFPCDDLKGFADEGMDTLEKLCCGVIRLMEKYAVQTCGYCSEVQVGPKGHRVRDCQAFKHQMRDGQHAWQEATFEDIVPQVYVWHVPKTHDKLLVHDLKRYYGKLPALVEMFAQAGAEVGQNYRGMMREDVVVPSLEEDKLVV